jgi:hypothetical protein
MNRIEQMPEIEELKILKARYFRYVDTKQWDAWGELFVEDCTFVDLAGDFRCSGRAKLVAQVAQALDGVVSIHHGHTPEIELVDAEHATGIWTMSDYLIYPPEKNFQSMDSSTKVHGYGHYVESYVKEHGVWRFAEVTVSRLHLEHHGTLTAAHPRIWVP